jgi:hypothetical protein
LGEDGTTEEEEKQHGAVSEAKPDSPFELENRRPNIRSFKTKNPAARATGF